MRSYWKLVVLFLLLPAIFKAQTINPSLRNSQWKASWITFPGEKGNEYGVYVFRKQISLDARPASFIVHISADNRYKLFVNGQLVSLGPTRGDFYFWNYETADLAPYLQQGTNTLAALVWNEGDMRPEAQISFRTGFILQGDGQEEEVANTNNSWKCIKDISYQPLSVHVPGYYAAGAAEMIHMADHTRGWEKNGFNDADWKPAQVLEHGTPKGYFDFSYGWMLVPSPLPQRELKTERLLSLREAQGVKVPAAFPSKKTEVTIPANTNAVILLDQTYLTNAYPTLIFSKGKDAGISVSYAEALYDANGGKGNRNEINGKRFIGKKDSLISDGSNGQNFTSLWWRTYRYLQLTIHTKNEPLVINDLYGTFTGYPFERVAKWQSDNASLMKIADIGWHTARLCAVETYMDCPYYEQLQYVGDTRIQALVSLYNTNDDRLVRNAITLLDHSRMAEGITQSRYPTVTPQQIPTFSLWWIGMLHDYWMYRPDSTFIKDKLPGSRQVLSFFRHYQQSNGSVADLPYWVFTDWVDNREGWSAGVAPVSKNGTSAIVDLQLMWTYQLAAEMEDALGMKEYARNYDALASQLKETIQKKYWDERKGLYADTEEKNVFSQHANSLAILAGMVKGEEAMAIGRKMLTDTSLAPASIYFKYYLHQALVKAGMGNDYLNWLDKWYENIRLGLTTWAEMSDVNASRSDCHAWGASPNIEFFRTVLGVDTDAPGFARVRIEPHLGALQYAEGSFPHPDGMLSVQYRKQGSKWHMLIDLPEHVSGTFIWSGKTYSLKEGKNEFNL